MAEMLPMQLLGCAESSRFSPPMHAKYYNDEFGVVVSFRLYGGWSGVFRESVSRARYAVEIPSARAATAVVRTAAGAASPASPGTPAAG